MKRLQIYIDVELDAALAVESRRQDMSKAALIRKYVAEGLGVRTTDPIDDLIGLVPGASDDSASISSTIYDKE